MASFLSPPQKKKLEDPQDQGSPRLRKLKGRLPYSAEEDAAILDFLRDKMASAGGNKVWKQMQQTLSTRRSWQSLKARYDNILRLRRANAKANAGASHGRANTEEGAKETVTAVHPESPLADDLPGESVEEEEEAEPEGSRNHGILYEATREFGDETEDEAPPPGCHAHLFIFSQKPGEEESEGVEEEEEASRILKQLMEASSQDLVSVTKALLRTSGDVSLAAQLLTPTGSAPSSPNPAPSVARLWRRHDDQRLLTGDQSSRQQLLRVFGEEGVARRTVFLDA